MAARISPIRGRMFPDSFLAGMTMEMEGQGVGALISYPP